MFTFTRYTLFTNATIYSLNKIQGLWQNHTFFKIINITIIIIYFEIDSTRCTVSPIYNKN